jgi:hypothetical protein
MPVTGCEPCLSPQHGNQHFMRQDVTTLQTVEPVGAVA